MFIRDEHNRAITERDNSKLRLLEASMQKYGFLPFPILVVRAGEKLKIIDGQHRFDTAKKLGLSVLFIETERDDIVIAECAAAQTPWNQFHYVATFASQGNKHYIRLLEFVKETGLPLSQSANMLGGEISTGTSAQKRIKFNRFVVRDEAYARRVAALVNAVRQQVPWALNSYCVAALSRFVRVPQFDDAHLIKKVQTAPHMLRRCSTVEMFSEMFSDLYNYGTQKRIPLSFMAKEQMIKRAKGICSAWEANTDAPRPRQAPLALAQDS